MTIQELNSKLDVALREYIKKKKHILTGALYESVLYKCILTNTGLSIKFNSMYYVKFLEHGEFINDFYNLQTTNEILQDFFITIIQESL